MPDDDVDCDCIRTGDVSEQSYVGVVIGMGVVTANPFSMQKEFGVLITPSRSRSIDRHGISQRAYQLNPVRRDSWDEGPYNLLISVGNVFRN